MIRPQIETAILVAWMQRRALKARYSSVETDGTTLSDSFGILGQWVDPTRIVLNEDRDAGRDLGDIEAFLAYWCRFYIIGVSRGAIEAVQA